MRGLITARMITAAVASTVLDTGAVEMGSGVGMGYDLGVDLGNTYVAAAVSRGSEIEMCPLGESSLVMPAVAHLAENGAITVGDPAVRRGLTDPERVVRGLRRRLGDPAPVVVHGRPHPVPDLLATLLRTVLAKVTEQQGAAPERVVLARPAAWDALRCSAYDEVARLAGLEAAGTVSEPEAVVRQYASVRQLADDRVLAVYDLGGGTFEVSLVRKLPTGVEILGEPRSIERLGGLDFDDALVDLVDHSLGGRLSALDPTDPGSVRLLARLREQCEHAKEALTADDEVEIPVSVGAEQVDVRITRADLEGVIGSHVQSTVRALEAALGSARMSAGQLDGILLVGGSSRIPLVARTIASVLGCPVRTNVSPKNLVALGAAASAGVPLGTTPAPTPAAAPALPPAPPPRATSALSDHGASDAEVDLGGRSADRPASARASTPSPPRPAMPTPPAAPMPAPPMPAPPMPAPPGRPSSFPRPPSFPSPPDAPPAFGQPHQPPPVSGGPPHRPPQGAPAPMPPNQQPMGADGHQNSSFEVRRFLMLLVLVAVLAAAGLAVFALATGLRL